MGTANGNSGKPAYSEIVLMLAGGFCSMLIVSNILSGAKIAQLWPEFKLLGFTIPANTISGGTLLFPITYIFADVCVEVYGFGLARKLMWYGFYFQTLTIVAIVLIGFVPWAPFGPTSDAYEACFGLSWRIAAASLAAYTFGNWANDVCLSVLKRLSYERSGEHTKKKMALRFLGSTIVGQIVDTLIFNVGAFAGVFESSHLWTMIIYNFGFKVSWEAVALIVTIPIVDEIKRSEGIDVVDKGMHYGLSESTISPLHLLRGFARAMKRTYFMRRAQAA